MLDIFPYFPALVVEQAELSRRLLEAHLALLNFSHIDGAEDVAIASRFLSKNVYSLIFVNLDLNEVAGLEFLANLATSRPCRSTLLVAMGGDHARGRSAAVQAGADAFLGRPTSPAMLQNLLVELLTSRAGWKSKIVPLPNSLFSAAFRRKWRDKGSKRDV